MPDDDKPKDVQSFIFERELAEVYLLPWNTPLNHAFCLQTPGHGLQDAWRCAILAVMPTPDLALVREFKRRAEQALPGRIVRVMLYGSRARGEARDDSDWDVAVFLKGEPTPTDRRVLSDIDFDLTMESGQHVQAIAIDHEQSAEQSYFVTNVLKDGLVA